MLDPFLSPPAFLPKLTQPLADLLALPTLPLHAHEILLAFTFYHIVNTRLSPLLSTYLFPSIYPKLNRRTKINWDVHVVSLVQSCLINTLALWVLWVDEERTEMNWRGRVWGYTGAGGMIQGFAAGYFLWDLMVSSMNVGVFGWGLLAHAVSALVVFSLGFRPFVNFYGPTFILYELSSPFLNFHWFFDKLHMTGSRAQLYNGLVLLFTFFGCRLVWGTYQSLRVYQDVWAALQTPGTLVLTTTSGGNDGTVKGVVEGAEEPISEIMKYAGEKVVPVWLACTYLGSNIVLNTLNFYWFGKMIETVKKRFKPPQERSKERSGGKEVADGGPVEVTGGPGIVVEEDGSLLGDGIVVERTEVGDDGRKVLTLEQEDVRRRR
ncbi:MAG: hypothetical protein M1836_005891 [Candelina mexicana]|nr:MAG: hypothetical protein M1836_005891 [Candelina mexicana]